MILEERNLDQTQFTLFKLQKKWELINLALVNSLTHCVTRSSMTH